MAVYLEEYIETVENFPLELRHHLHEIRTRDDQSIALRKAINELQKQYLNEPSPELHNKIQAKFTQAKKLADEKILLAEKLAELMSRHVKRLDEQVISASKNADESVLSSLLEPLDRRKKRNVSDDEDTEEEEEYEESADNGEAAYCICRQASYGEMVACDNAENCPYEWFHIECVGLSAPPVGSWFCPICAPRMRKKK